MTIRPLDSVLEEKARLELNENPNRIHSDLQHMQDWLDKQPHLRARRDDQWLIAFLRGCKYSLERAKEKLDLFYSLRTLAPELYHVRHNDPRFNEIMDLEAILILPKLATPDSPRVTIVRMGRFDPNRYKMTEVFAVSNILQRIMLYDDDSTVVAGVRSVLDMEGVTVNHVLQMTPTIMKKVMVMAQDALPLRLKGAHYINTPPGVETVFNTIKTFLNENNKNRFYVRNKNYDELYKFIPKEVLPKEYGGNGETAKEIVEYWKDKVKQYSSWLDEDVKYGTDEDKRTGEPKSAESLFGLEGSFRKLDFD